MAFDLEKAKSDLAAAEKQAQSQSQSTPRKPLEWGSGYGGFRRPDLERPNR